MDEVSITCATPTFLKLKEPWLTPLALDFMYYLLKLMENGLKRIGCILTLWNGSTAGLLDLCYFF